MRPYTALTLIALAASSTAATPALKLAQTPPAHRLSIPEVYDKLVQKKNSAFEVATEFKNQLKSRVFEYRSGLADVRAAVTGDHATRAIAVSAFSKSMSPTFRALKRLSGRARPRAWTTSTTASRGSRARMASRMLTS